jgi:hypothetical protein
MALDIDDFGEEFWKFVLSVLPAAKLAQETLVNDMLNWAKSLPKEPNI